VFQLSYTWNVSSLFVQLYKTPDPVAITPGRLKAFSGYTWTKIFPTPPVQWQIQPHFLQSNHNVWWLAVYNENEDKATEIKKIKGGGNNKHFFPKGLIVKSERPQLPATVLTMYTSTTSEIRRQTH